MKSSKIEPAQSVKKSVAGKKFEQTRSKQFPAVVHREFLALAVRNLPLLRYGVLLLTILFVSLICCGKKVPQIVIERWPHEGVPVIAWTSSGNSLALYSHPGDEKPVSFLAVKKNQRLQWDRSLILVKKLGKLKFLEDCVMSTFVYDSLQDHKLVGGKPKEIDFSADTVLDVVCSASEGDYIFLYLDRFVEMSGSNGCQQMLTKPQTQWWVRLKRNGRPLGWVKVDGEKLTVVERRF